MSSAPYPRGLIDTEILAGVRSGHAGACQFTRAILTVGWLEMSTISVLAVIGQCGDTVELSHFLRLVRHSRVYQITDPVSLRAFRLMSALPPPAPLTADDALIAATALARKLPLYTLDPARFAGISGLSVIRPY